MLIYVAMFILSLIFIYFGNINRNKLVKIIFIFLGILLPCLLACFRDITIGKDTSGYILNLFNIAKKGESFNEFYLNAKYYLQIQDYGYLFITYISAKFFNNFNVLLFFIEILVIVPIYVSLSCNKKNVNDIILGFIIFYLFFYNVTFNMARQSIALAFLILGITLLTHKKIFKSFLCLLISVLFHSTAIVAVLIYVVYYLLLKCKNQKMQKYIILFIYILSILYVINYKFIINWLYSMNIYKHGQLYLQRFNVFDFSFTDTFVYSFILFMIIKSKKELLKKEVNFKFYKFLAIESLIILQLGAFIQYMERVSFYFFYPVLFNCISMIGTKMEKNKISKNEFYLIIFFIVYWIYTFGILNSHNTIPYIFS